MRALQHQIVCTLISISFNFITSTEIKELTFLGQIFAVGGWTVTAELLSVEDDTWRKTTDFPYESNKIGGFAMVYHEGGFLLFGGEESTSIYRFDESTEKWSKIGDLKQSRNGPSVVYDGEYFLAGCPKEIFMFLS